MNRLDELNRLLAKEPDQETVRCTRCPLWETSIVQYEDTKTRKVCIARRSRISWRGEPRASILLVGESPGAYEVALNEAFIGPSGAFLTENLEKVGLNPQEIRYTNAFRCYPPMGKVPDMSIWEPCLEYLSNEIASVKPKVIGALGSTALDALGRVLKLPKSKYVLSDWVGKEIRSKIVGRSGKSIWGPVVVPAFHPAAYLRQKEDNPLSWLVDYSFQNSLRIMARHASIPIPDSIPRYTCLEKYEDVVECLCRLRNVKLLSVDTETSPTDTFSLREKPCPWEDRIFVISFAWGFSADEAVSIPLYRTIKKRGDPLLPWFKPHEQAHIEDLIASLMEDENIGKFGHNFMVFDRPVIEHNYGCVIRNICDDTQILKHQMDQDTPNNLADIGFRVTPFGGHKDEMKEEMSIYPEGSSFALASHEVVTQYAASDAHTTYWIRDHYRRKMKLFDEKHRDPYNRGGMTGFYEDVAMPVSDLALHMMKSGIYIDKEYAESLCGTAEHDHTDGKYAKELSALNDRFLASPEVRETVRLVNERKLAKKVNPNQMSLFPGESRVSDDPKQFNVRSNVYTHTLFFDVLKLPVVKRNAKGNRTAGKVAIEIWEKTNPMPLLNLLGDIRRLKAYQGYLSSQILGKIDADGRLRTNYLITGTETGRWTSVSPNLQNIPSRGLRAKEIQRIFAAPPGYVLIKEDIKQAEFRLFAVYADDYVMKQDIVDGLDVHTYFAARAYGVTEDEVIADKKAGGEMRSNAKNGVFAMLYGAQPPTVANQLRIPIGLAEALRDAMWGRYKDAYQWTIRIRQFAEKNGFVRSLHSRIRVAPDALSASNSPVQAAAFDENCTKGLVVLSRFEKEGLDARLCLNIHDCIASEVRLDQWKKAVHIHRTSVGAITPKLDLPFPTDLEVGFNMSDVHSPEEFEQLLLAA